MELPPAANQSFRPLLATTKGVIRSDRKLKDGDRDQNRSMTKRQKKQNFLVPCYQNTISCQRTSNLHKKLERSQNGTQKGSDHTCKGT